MASRRGIIVTIVVLAGITAASFLAWLPGSPGSTFVVSDHEEYLDGVKSIQEVLLTSIEIEFSKMLDGEITPADYVASAEMTSSQVTSQISEFIKSKPPEDWQESYIAYGEALKIFNAFVVETEVLANMLEKDGQVPPEQMQDALRDIEQLKMEFEMYKERSDATRP